MSKKTKRYRVEYRDYDVWDDCLDAETGDILLFASRDEADEYISDQSKIYPIQDYRIVID